MPRRRILSEITPNERPGFQLSNDTKNRIKGRMLAGQRAGEIAEEENLLKRTVNKRIQRLRETGNHANKARSGRPRKWNKRDETHILWIIRKQPKLTYEDLAKESGLDLKRDTLRVILEKNGITHWRAKRRPHLSEEVARLRLQFAIENIDLDWVNDPSEVIFSDECSVEMGVGKKRPWAFGHPSQKWDHNKVSEYPKGRQGSVMIWCSIGGSALRSELVVMERDEESLRKGYSANSYLQTLRDGLRPIYEGELFMQDNAPIHTASKSTAWLHRNHILFMTNWPPYSPDLNPIEHLWPRLKEAIYQLNPDIDLITNKQAQAQALREVLPEAWKSLRPEVIQGCLDSMRHRLQAVIDAHGWHTKY